MSITHGMDAAEVEELARFLQDRAARLRHIAQEINARVYSSIWNGDEAQLFSQQLWPRHRARLLAAADRLDGLAQSARNNASAQRDASAVGAGAGAGAGGRGATGLAASAAVGAQRRQAEQGGAFGPHYDELSAGATGIGALGGVKGLIDLGRGIQKAPGPLDLLTVPFDVVDVATAVAAGDPRAAIPGASGLVLTGLGTVATGIAAPAVAVGAVGAVVINTVYEPEHTVTSYIERTYGGADNMTTEQATELSHRYDGWSGFGHFAVDGAHGFARTSGGNVQDAWNRIF